MMDTMQLYWQGSRQQWNLPNSISLSRAFLGFAASLWWFEGETWLFSRETWLLIVIVYAGFSDWLDGWLARRQGEVTPIGAVIDPLADKCFTNPFLLGIAISTGSLWLSLLFVVNLLYDADNTCQRRFDILRAFRGQYGLPSKPVTWLSKTKTAVLFVLMVAALYPQYLLFITLNQFAGVALGLVAWSWFKNRWETITYVFGR